MDLYARMKDQLVREIPARDCCRVAELSALVKSDGTLSVASGQWSLAIRDSNAAVARKTISLLRHAGCTEFEVVLRKSMAFRRANSYVIRILKHADVKALLGKLGLVSSEGFAVGVPEQALAKRCCRRSYVRGAFLGAGYVGDPEHGYHLEIACSDRRYAEALSELLETFELRPRVLERRNQSIVYLKDSEDVVEFLRVVGATGALLELENARIIRSIRNEVNRLVNAEQANLQKTVDASIRQVQDIRYIDEHLGLHRLPEPLYQFARLRLEHPDASLSELGAMSDPPLGKSGANHRMRRLARIALSLRERA